MKNIRSLVLFVLLFCIEISFSQNSLTYSPLSQTVDLNSGTEGTVNVLVSCYGSSSNPLFLNIISCGNNDGLQLFSYSNGNSLTPGKNTTIQFKFKKTVTTDTQIVYKFSTNGSCFQAESQMIKITINYKSAPVLSCALPFPANFNISNIQSNSIKYNWNSVSGAASYVIGYTRNWPNWQYVTLSNSQTSYVLNSLLPDTTYRVFVVAVCSNGAWGSTGIGSTSATGSSLEVKTLCNNILTSPISNLTATPYSYGYKVDFTPITNFDNGSYILEYVDLVTNSSGVVSPFSLLPAGATYPNFYYIQAGHSFKIRVIGKLGCSTTYSNWLTVNGACPLAPTQLYVVSNGGNGSFNWSQVSDSVNYQGEFLIYNLAGQNVTATFSSTTNVYSATVNTGAISGDKFIKFRMKSQCSNGAWSDFSDWSSTSIWNN